MSYFNAQYIRFAEKLEVKLFSRLLFIALYFVGTSLASAKPWDDTISDVEARSDYLFEQARLRGLEAFWLGTATNELGVEQHKCAILGRMLGRQEYIQDLEEFVVAEPKTEMSEEETFELLISARMLENWAYTARRILVFSDDERKATWNLDCVGSFNIPAIAALEETTPNAKFRVEGDVLYVLGDIQPGFAEEFASYVAATPNIETVALGSAGGSVYDAMKAGQMIRALGLNTTLASNCYSACPLIFLGGVRRTIWSPYPTLGFHQMYMLNGVAVQPIDGRYQAIKEYSSIMGVDPNFVIASMFAAAPSDMYEPEFKALCASKVVTGIQRFC